MRGCPREGRVQGCTKASPESPGAEGETAARPARVQPLPLASAHTLSPAAGGWKIGQQVLSVPLAASRAGSWALFHVGFVAFYLALQNFAFYRLEQRMEPGTRCCWLGLAAELPAHRPGGRGSLALAEVRGGRARCWLSLWGGKGNALAATLWSFDQIPVFISISFHPLLSRSPAPPPPNQRFCILLCASQSSR